MANDLVSGQTQVRVEVFSDSPTGHVRFDFLRNGVLELSVEVQANMENAFQNMPAPDGFFGADRLCCATHA
ncbi:MAG: hypothetical protein WAT77_14105 [Paracoccaceae bacterium]